MIDFLREITAENGDSSILKLRVDDLIWRRRSSKILFAAILSLVDREHGVAGEQEEVQAEYYLVFNGRLSFTFALDLNWGQLQLRGLVGHGQN